jgi:hypothetical protein
VLGIGSGGIGWTGSNTLAQMFLPINFVTATSVIYNTHTTSAANSPGQVNTYGNWTSSASGGTTVRWIADSAKNAGGLYFQGSYTVGANIKSDANVRWELHNGGMYLTQTNGLTALGTNKLYIGRESRSSTRDIALLVSDNRNLNLQNADAHAYFDTPLEFNAALNTYANRFQFQVDHRILGYNGGAVVTTNYTMHIRGAWSTLGGTNLDANGDGGPIWLYGGIADPRAKIYMEADNSSLKSVAKMGTSSNSAIYIRSGWFVANAPHAFGTNNSLLVRLAEANASGGTLNRAYLATSGNNVSGEVVLWGGGGTVGGDPLRSFIGLEGAGTVEFSGDIWMLRRDALTPHQVHNMYLTAPSNGTLTVSGKIQEAGSGFVRGLNITGGGTVVVSGNNNTYTNTTTVMSNTTLRLDGSLATSMLTVDSGSKLQGTGTLTNDLAVSGIMAPGNSIGTFTVRDDATFNTSSFFDVELSVSDNMSDQLIVLDALDITGATLRLFGGKAGETYTFVTYGGVRTGTAFNSIDVTQLGAGLSLDTSTYADGVNEGTGSNSAISLTVIPEPASVLLMVSGLVAAWKLRRRA